MSWLNKENRIWYITIFLLLLAGFNYALNAWTYRTGVSLTGETFYWPFLLPRFLNFLLPSSCQAPLLLLLIGLYILWRQRPFCKAGKPRKQPALSLPKWPPAC